MSKESKAHKVSKANKDLPDLKAHKVSKANKDLPDLKAHKVSKVYKASKVKKVMTA